MSILKEYAYVGSEKILSLITEKVDRVLVNRPDDILRWIRDSRQKPDRENAVTATFIISTRGDLWVADRHSEHVVCATGEHVLAAGEITFAVKKGLITVVGVTNQSTGYCPEPESWPEVAKSLDAAGIPHPNDYTSKFIFRRCSQCGQINIVKDDWFECVCGSTLDPNWNIRQRVNSY